MKRLVLTLVSVLSIVGLSVPMATPVTGASIADGATAAPTGLVASVASTTQVDLAWVGNADDELGFRIERSPDGTIYAEVGSVAAGILAFSDTTAVNGDTYRYKVVAFNATNEAASGTVTITVAAPVAATGLAATVISATSIDVVWADQSNNETGFRLERSLDGTTYTAVGSVAANIRVFSDTTAVNGATYQYRVVAFNPVGEAASGVAIITAAAPNAPSDLTAIVMSATRVDLVWTDQSNNEASFRVERSLDSFTTAPGATLPAAAGARTLSDLGVAAANAYSYRVVAVNGAGDSAPSNVVTVTVTAGLLAGPIDPATVYPAAPAGVETGIPGYYQDDQGTRVALMPVTGNGVTDPTLIFDPVVGTNAYSVFKGFGTEAFYWYADSAFNMPNGGLVVLVLGVEHAFGGAGDAVPGQEFVFTRTRVRVDVPMAGTYTVTYPYGALSFTVTPAEFAATAGRRAINYTSDIGIPRDFAAATINNGGVTRFLRPVTPAPAGWVGDGASIGPVTGSPTGFNKVRVQGPVGSNLGGVGIDFYEYNLFMVSGRIPSAVTPLPDFTATIAPVDGLAPATVTFADTSTGAPTTWLWDFGDGTTSTLQNPPAKTYNTPGNYLVKLTVSNAVATVSTSRTVRVFGVPVASFTHSIPNGIPPVTINFTDTSTGGPERWLWDFGDGVQSALQNPSHVYAAAGAYTVTLTVTSPAGTSTISHVINISGSLVANFTRVLAPVNGVAPVTVTFTDTSVGTLTDWLWDFGDGTTSTLQNPPAHAYNTAGNYVVTLTVTDAAGEAATSQVMSVYSPLTASFTTNRTFGPVPLAISFTDTSTGNAASWLWDFGDGTTSTLQNPSKTYNAFGRYTVTLTVQNAATPGGSSVSHVLTASTVDPATLVLQVGPIDPNSIYLGDLSTGWPAHYQDDQGTRAAFLPLSPGQVFDPPVAGNAYSQFLGFGTEAMYWMANANADTSVGRMTAVFALEGAFGGAGNAVPGQEFVFARTRIVADVPVAGAYLFEHPYGSVTINVTAADLAGGGIFYTSDLGVQRDFLAAGAANVSRFLRPVTPPPFGLIGDGTVGTVTGSPIGFNKVRLTGPAGSNLGGPGVDFVETDLFSVRGRLATGLAPGFTFAFNPASAVAPNTVTFTDTTTGGVPLTRLWDFGDGTTSTLLNPTHVYNAAGNYTVMLTVTDAAGTATATRIVPIIGLPVASFTLSAATGLAPLTVTFTDTSAGNPLAWAWTFGDGTTSTLQNPFHVYTVPGVYNVTLTVTNLAGFASVTKTVTVTGVPAAPTGLTAAAASATSVNFAWTDAANNETGFSIERSLSPTTGFAQVGTVAANIQAYSDNSVAAATTYHYRVFAYNPVGPSATAAGPASVTTPAAAAPALTPAPAPGVPLTGLTSSAPFIIDNQGVVQATVTVTTTAGDAKLNVAAGTKATDKAGQPIVALTAATLVTPPPPPPTGTIVLAYEFGPTGSQFNPPIPVTIGFNPATLPAGTRVDKLQVAYWDTANAKWIKLNSVVDTATNTITARVSHFTEFAVIHEPEPEPAAPAPGVTITTPLDNGSLPAGDVTVKIQTQDFELVTPGAPNAPNQGHAHFYLDMEIPTTPGKPAVTAPGTYKATPGSGVVWENVPAGTHTFGVQLVNSDHTPLDPPVTAKVTVTVAATAAVTPAPAPPVPSSPAPSTPAAPPVATPPATPVPAAPVAINWLLVGGMVAAVLVVVVLVVVMRKRTR